MITKMRKILALIVCAAVLAGTCSFMCCAYNPAAEQDTLNGAEFGKLSANTSESQKYAQNTVAVFYLCSNWTGLPSLGHIWTYVENVSKKTLKIGTFYILPGEGVSVGKFALTRSDGPGIYYNVESYTANLFGMEDSLYLKAEMTMEDVEDFSTRILYSNFWDPLIFNCASFAIEAWNSVSSQRMFPFVILPFVARIQMASYGAKTNLKMYDPGRNNVFKQTGLGDDATMRPVSNGTVDTPPG